MMKSETWMTSEQALENGFADEIAGKEVVAYLSEDKKTAFFNGQKLNIENISNKETLTSILNVGNISDIENKAIKDNPKSTANSEKNEEKESITMNLEELKAKYPEVYNAAVKDGIEQGIVQGTQNERARIAAIESLAPPGMEDLINKAKYETGITAEALAVEVLKAQKEKGISFLNQTRAETAHLDNLPAAEAPQNATKQEEDALIAEVKARAAEIDTGGDLWS